LKLIFTKAHLLTGPNGRRTKRWIEWCTG